jgi:hypothetical protein
MMRERQVLIAIALAGGLGGLTSVLLIRPDIRPGWIPFASGIGVCAVVFLISCAYFVSRRPPL